MGDVVTNITDAVGITDSGEGARASESAANVQASYQKEALDYLKQRERVPTQYREGALSQLGGLYGVQGGDPNAYQNIRQSAAYQSALGDRDAQEEAILRNQAATGALRTGATDQMLAENERQREYQAFQSATGGLQSLAGLPSLAPAIAQQTSAIGQTYAQGQVGAAQSRQAGQQAEFGNILGAVNLGLSAYDMFSS